ncbi:short-chain dehydrogenase/reductase [Kocuria sp. WRN011]|uniref:SDR family oxidoreductase n=1 Tax=Kocuria sp. WRN011 TaxID=2029858 RepID=UPI000BAEA9C2|nr:SDR family oxidoreductase [Kocuria sp. WRN011]PBB09019.1 short-chain dehydrogenase/reductase [Kocuria sp. WRN011]
MSNVWFITGAARGMGIDLAKAALDAGHNVVGTARDAARVTQAIGEHENLLALSLDVTQSSDSEAAVQAAVERFGSIDVLVNNAGNFYAGYFEEISDEQMRRQMETNFFGPLNVTRAILPVMRKQRGGHVFTITSAAGIIGQEFCAAYASSKFALEGWMESLRFDLEPFGIHTTIVEPGFFRTELLVEEASTNWPALSIDDYKERTAQTIENWKGMNGQQPGDPAKLGAALVTLANLETPPLRFVAGEDVVAGVEEKAQTLLDQVAAHRELSSSMALENA